MTTFSHPFVHYQTHKLINSDGQEVALFSNQAFLPVTCNMCVFTSKSWATLEHVQVESVVYNLYLYDEHAVFVESFGHEFKRPIDMRQYLMRASGLFVKRKVTDAFPRVDNLSGHAKALTIWQFSELV